ncbi:MAG: cellulase family glycosylhydrolase [Bacteroidales bacterium]
MKKIRIILGIIVISACLSGQNRAHEINAMLGRGVNLGNGFEAPRDVNWGLEIRSEYLEIIADKGFSHVRVPIRWNDYAGGFPYYTIEPWFIDTVKKVVDAALANKLLVMINIHHYDEFNDNPLSNHRTRFLAIWKQISLEFRDYSDSVLFEFLNEPHQNMDATNWNAVYKQVLDTVRVDNPDRICVVGPPDWNNVNSVDKLSWTADTNMILTVHYYNPFQFTHQGASWVNNSDSWLGTTWDSTASQRQAVIDEFAKVRTFSEANNVPVHVGEFGAYSTADDVSRAKWTSWCARTFESFGFSWAYWEFGAGFGVYDPVNGIWRNFLLNALTEQIDPLSIPPDPWEIGNGDFSNGNTGWNFYTQGEAAATQSVVNETAEVEVSAVDGSYWHVQLSQSGISLIQGGEYRLTFDARAAEQGEQITSYIGKSSDPYNAYSNHESYLLSTTMITYSFTFTMMEPSDPNARVVFDLAHDTATIWFDNILLEQLYVPVLVEKIVIEPNPVVINEKEGRVLLNVVTTPENANNKAVTWEIVSGQQIATIDSEGVLTATGTADGNVRVKATAVDGSGVFAEIIATVSNQLLVESITLTPTKTVIDTYKGSSRIFYDVQPVNASNKALHWEVTSGIEIAKVSQEGFVDALGMLDGSVTITATSTDGSGISSEVIILVINQVLVEQLKITASASTIDVLQGSLQLNATVLPENASRKEIVWSITEGKSLAVFTQQGLLTASGTGNGTVTVKAAANDGSGVTDQTDITLTNQGTGIENQRMPEFRMWIDNSILFLQYPASTTERSFSLYTMDGRKILQHAVPYFGTSLNIPVGQYRAGIYIVKFEGEVYQGTVDRIYLQ